MRKRNQSRPAILFTLAGCALMFLAHLITFLHFRRIDVATKKARVENGGSDTLPIITGPRMAKREPGGRPP